MPTGTPLLDPATATIPSGCSANYTSHIITCASGTPTFTGWDFSLEGGWLLQCTAATSMTVARSNFAVGTNAQDMLVVNGTCGAVSVTYRTMNEEAASGSNAIINAGGATGTGTLTVQYNILENSAP